MAKNATKIILVAVVIASLVLPFLKSRAAEKTEVLKEVNDIIDNLINLKDDSDLSKEEKEQQEISIRREALEKILDLSIAEAQDLKKKLESLNLKGGNQIDIKNNFLDFLKNYEEYYEKLRSELDQQLTIDLLKNIAKEFKIWKEKEYNPKTQAILSFALIYNEKSILKTADERLDKIISDLKKLENAKMIKKNTFQSELNNSMKNLTNAHLLNSNAENIFLESIKDILFASSTASSSVSFENEEIATTTATSTKKLLSLETEIKQLIEKSLKEIKSAYNNFLSISKSVKKKLGF